MTDKCRVKIIPDDKLAIKIIVWGCEKELEKIREKAGDFTNKWLDEKIEYHDWSEDEA